MYSESFLVIFLAYGVIFGIACAAIWGNKGGNRVSAFLLGLLLGIIGLIIVAATNPTPSGRAGEMSAATTRTCPFCKSAISPDASVCRFCQRESEAWRWIEGVWVARNEQGEYWWRNERTGKWFRVRTTDMCPSCGASMPADEGRCPNCGQQSSDKMEALAGP
jgi:RNA polymerase subunit RPABC4/transcription elongation factor Spt4